MNDLISIIVPVYNVEAYLDKCISSLVNQTYKNIEIILVDDGSPDNCPFICDRWAKKDNRIKVIHKKNGGQSSARNTALDRMTGQYVAFVDSDDYVCNDFIEKLYNDITTQSADISICGYYEVDLINNHNRKVIVEKRLIVSENDYWKLEIIPQYHMFSLALWNKLFKKEIWNDLRFKLGKYAEDVFAMNKYIPKAHRISIINDALYHYIQRTDSLAHSFGIKNLDIVEANFERCLQLIKVKNNKMAKRTLRACASKMNEGFQRVDLHIPENLCRYTELRKKYKKIYHKVYKSVELNYTWALCFSYCFSDRLFSITNKFFREVSQIRKK